MILESPTQNEKKKKKKIEQVKSWIMHDLFIQWKIYNADEYIILVELSNQKLCKSKFWNQKKKKTTKSKYNNNSHKQ